MENIRRDGCLTTVPVVYPAGEALEVLSGNHRVMAAIRAGLEESEVLEITTPLSEQQRVAIQLSHNAIVGEDDPSVLAELWAALDFDFKRYSGITDEDLGKLAEIESKPLSVEALKYDEIRLAFLADEAKAFLELLTRIGEAARTAHWVLGRYDDFTSVFDATIAVKARLNIHNGAVALKAMADLAMERLAEIERERT